MVFNDSNIFEIKLNLVFKLVTVEPKDAKENGNSVKEKD
jgi:hypothetical protein